MDASDFNRLVSRIDNATRRADSTPEASRADVATELLRFYGGNLIEKEPRDPLQLQCVTGCGKSLCAQVQHSVKVWSNADNGNRPPRFTSTLELDNLGEGLYRRLMTSRQELGEVAEALKDYRRCRGMLSIALGLKPSAETEAIHATLRSP